MNVIPALSFQLEALDQQGNFRIDVFARDVPSKFLGVGFDVTLSSENWKYEKYELGPLFSQNKDILSLATQKDNPQRLVFGLTLKHDANMNFSQGEIASFFIKLSPSELKLQETKVPFEIHFNHGVLSIYENQRKDVGQVDWIDGSFNLERVLQSAIHGNVKQESILTTNRDTSTSQSNSNISDEAQSLLDAQQDFTLSPEMPSGHSEASSQLSTVRDLSPSPFDLILVCWFLGGILVACLVFAVLRVWFLSKSKITDAKKSLT